MKKAYYFLFSLVAVLALGACGSSGKGNFTGEGLLGNLPEQMIDGVLTTQKFGKERKKIMEENKSTWDFIAKERDFYKENNPEGYVDSLNHLLYVIEEKLKNYPYENETKYKIEATGVEKACADTYGQGFDLNLYVMVNIEDEKVRTGWRSLVYADTKSPDDMCYALWDKEGNLLGCSTCNGETKGTTRTYTIYLGFSYTLQESNDYDISEVVETLERMDKIAKITLIPRSKYEKLRDTIPTK